MKNKIYRILSLFLAITIVCSSLMMLTSCASGKKDLTAVSDENYVNFADGFTEEKVTDEASALKAVESVAAELGITDVEKELKVASVNTVGGDKYYRMQQYYEGYPVYGRTVVLAADSDGDVTTLTSNSESININNIEVKKNSIDAKLSVEKYINEELKSDEKGIFPSEIELGIIKINNTYKLAYNFVAIILTQKNTSETWEFFVDANNAEILQSMRIDLYDTVEASGIDKNGEERKFNVNQQAQNEFVLEDTERNIVVYNAGDNTLDYRLYDKNGKELSDIYEANSNSYLLIDSAKYFASNNELTKIIQNNNTWSDNKAVSLAANIKDTYDFYSTILKHNGTNGQKNKINVFYNDNLGGDTSNAFCWGIAIVWQKEVVLSFGTDNSISIDTVGHEYTHGVERSISKMVYSGESGAIMEAYSDIFGELIEDYSKNGVLDNDCDWKHGNRNMINPTDNKDEICFYFANDQECPFVKSTGKHLRDNSYVVGKNNCKVWGSYPKFYQGENWINTQLKYDNGGVHTNNTVLSHAAYLMNTGIDGTASKKIGTEQLAELWFRSMLLLQSDATFRQCANAVLVSAQQMFYNDPKNFTAEKLRCVEEAFIKVGITSNATAATWIENGGKIHVVDVTTNKKYDNYHIKFEQINFETRVKEIVAEDDVTHADGYTINLPEGIYIVTVSDNTENGSEYEYSKTINVSQYKLDDLSRNPEKPMLLVKNIYMYTDFRVKTPATDFTIPTDMLITLGELGVIEPEITPADADSYSIKWSSSNEEVATVSPNGEAGIITTLSKGTTVITAELTSGEKTITKTTNLRVASKARDTVLVLDISGSMYGEPLREMKKSAIQFCNDLLKDEYNNRVGLVFYDDEVTAVPLTADLNLLISEIEQIDDGGLTNMEAGLATADSMLKNNGRAEAIKNVVVMADGIPNEGKTSNSGSLPLGETYSRYTGSIIYANAVIDTAKRMQKSYNMYSLGFFHDLDGDAKDFAVALMKEVASKPEDYHQVDKAENLQFAFGDISEDISAGSKIVINIACPVDVKVTYGNETLSSANDSFCNTTSFGTLQLLGKNKDIKVITVDSDKDYNIEIVGTGDGKMDYSVNYFNEQEQLVDYRSFETVPITKTTVIKSNTNNDNAVDLNIDKDGDGKNDEVWTADVKSKGAVVEDKGPDNLNSVISGSSESSSSNSESSETDGNNVGIGIGLTVTALVVLILVIAGVVLVGVMIIVIIFAARSKKKKALPQNNMQNIPISSYQQKVRTDNQSGAKTLISVQENITQAAPRMVGTIEFISGPMTGFAVPIKDGETLFIGKDPKFANIVIDSVYTKVSRKHCSISYDAKTERYYVIDTSLNGTYLKGVTQLTKGEQALIDVNSILLLGNEECAILLK